MALPSSSDSIELSSHPPGAQEPRRDCTAMSVDEHRDNEDNEDDENDRKGASWLGIPGKQQLMLIVLARLVDSIAAGSIQSYILFQLKSFPLADGSLPDTATVALHLSVLRACFAVAQLSTSVFWARLTDHPRVGRKRVIVLSLSASGAGSFGLAYARSFSAALAWRLFVGLASSSIPAMKSLVRQTSGKQFESRAVLLLPAAVNVGSVLGPLLGGFLVGGAVRAGRAAAAGGLSAFWLPNVVNASVQLCVVPVLLWRLRDIPAESDLDKQRRRQPVSMVPEWATSFIRHYILRQPRYELLSGQHHEYEGDGQDLLEAHMLREKERISFWTRQMILTLAARVLMMMHTAIYPSLLMVFASTPRYNPSDENAMARFGTRTNNTPARETRAPSLPVPPGYRPSGPLVFTGGLGFGPHDLALALAIRGLVGLALQLLLFPMLRDLLGTLRLYRFALVVFPATYFATPYLAVIPSSTPPPLPASGVPLWAVMAGLFLVQSTARSMALPASEMLLNAASPDRSVLSTVHGISQSGNAAARIAGQLVVTGWLYGMGLAHGVVGAAWWGMAIVAILGAAVACL